MGGKVDPRTMREVNRALVLDLIRTSGRLSRTELARLTEMAKPTVATIVEDLIDDGSVREVGLGDSMPAGGRPPRLLEFNEESVAYAGIHFGITSTRVALADGRGNLRAVHRAAPAKRTPAAIARSLPDVFAMLAKEGGLRADRIQAVGVSVPGLVDVSSGRCVVAPNLEWRDVPVRELVADAVNLPVEVRNGVQAGAIAEGRFGAARDLRSYVCVDVGSGVGAAIVTDGTVFFGDRGFTGEIGHCPVVDDGPLCSCGRQGCLETLASSAALIRDAEAMLTHNRSLLRRRKITLPTLLDAAAEGDEVAVQAFARLAGHLGKGIAYLVNILNPQTVVIGGSMVGAGDVLLQPLRDTLRRHTLTGTDVRVVPSELGELGELRGAVLLASEAAPAPA
jgi:glucokinase-like ROK family protein